MYRLSLELQGIVEDLQEEIDQKQTELQHVRSLIEFHDPLIQRHAEIDDIIFDRIRINFRDATWIERMNVVKDNIRRVFHNVEAPEDFAFYIAHLVSWSEPDELSLEDQVYLGAILSDFEISAGCEQTTKEVAPARLKNDYQPPALMFETHETPINMLTFEHPENAGDEGASVRFT
jgi:hypothetical protein